VAFGLHFYSISIQPAVSFQRFKTAVQTDLGGGRKQIIEAALLFKKSSELMTTGKKIPMVSQKCQQRKIPPVAGFFFP
jgi:hypothetical protein